MFIRRRWPKTTSTTYVIIINPLIRIESLARMIKLITIINYIQVNERKYESIQAEEQGLNSKDNIHIHQ